MKSKGEIEMKKSKNEEYCTCGIPKGVTSDTESDECGYWDVCVNCGKRIEDGFHYYNHYDWEDRVEMDDDIW